MRGRGGSGTAGGVGAAAVEGSFPEESRSGSSCVAWGRSSIGWLPVSSRLISDMMADGFALIASSNIETVEG